MDVDPPLQAYSWKERSLEKMWELEKCSVRLAVPRSEEGNEVHSGETWPSSPPSRQETSGMIYPALLPKQQGLGNAHKHMDVATILPPSSKEQVHRGGKVCQLAHHRFPYVTLEACGIKSNRWAIDRAKKHLPGLYSSLTFQDWHISPCAVCRHWDPIRFK